MSTTTINTTVLENEDFRELTANELTAAQGGAPQESVSFTYGEIKIVYHVQ
jgi:hypothetical protein